MIPSLNILLPLFATSIFFLPILSQVTATVSIYNNTAFTDQRRCAIDCVLCGGGTYDCLGSTLSCNSPLLNSCYCRSDLQAAAVSYIASCVNSACSNTIDVANAVGVYTSYCATADQTSSVIAATTSRPPTTLVTETGSLVSVVSSTITAANGQPSTVLFTVTPTASMLTHQCINEP